MNKQDIKAICLKEHQETILHFEKLMNEHKLLSDIDENETKDPDDFSHQDESNDMVKSLQEQLNRAKQEFRVIESLTEDKCDSISFGAIAQTDMGYFYISSPGKIVYQEKEILCISTEAPFYRSINGKKIGDEFIFNNETHKIIAIY